MNQNNTSEAIDLQERVNQLIQLRDELKAAYRSMEWDRDCDLLIEHGEPIIQKLIIGYKGSDELVVNLNMALITNQKYAIKINEVIINALDSLQGFVALNIQQNQFKINALLKTKI
jgi:hypothetical protein